MLLLLILVVSSFVLLGMAVILIRKQYRTKQLFASINDLQSQRNELLPELLEIMNQEMGMEEGQKKTMLNHRTKTLARNVDIEEKIIAENELNRMMESLLDKSIHYPDLRSEADYIRLSESWNQNNENLIKARNSYNQLVKDYNYALKSFPTNVIAKLLQYKQKSIFEMQELS